MKKHLNPPLSKRARTHTLARARNSRRRTAAFSLVEMCVAMAIFVFAISTTLGLLSVALDSSRDSQRDSTFTSMLYNLDSDIRAASDTAAITALTATPRRFDISGKPVATNSPEAIYTVQLSVSPSASVGTLFALERSTNVNLWVAKVSHSVNHSSVTILLGSTRPGL